MSIRDTLNELLTAARDHSTYSKGDSDFSVTQLIGPAALTYHKTRQHLNPNPEVAEAMAEGNFYAMMGTAVHSVIENAIEASGKDALVEHRMFADFDGCRISGCADLIIDGWIIDWKFASVWEVLHGMKPERERQLNLLACLARENGMDIKGVGICYIFRDWSASKAQFDKTYPQSQRYMAQAPLWPGAEAESYLRSRVAVHDAYRTLAVAGQEPDVFCSEEERWAKPDVWAVRKGSNKRAVKLYQNEGDANLHAQDNVDFWVEHRPGESTRCELYCPFKDVCKGRGGRA